MKEGLELEGCGLVAYSENAEENAYKVRFEILGLTLY